MVARLTPGHRDQANYPLGTRHVSSVSRSSPDSPPEAHVADRSPLTTYRVIFFSVHKTTLFRALLVPTAVLALTACGGGDDTEPNSSPSPTADPTVASSSAPPAAAAVEGDKKLCEAANKASMDLRQSLLDAVSEGQEPTAEMFQDIFTGLATEFASIAATGDADSAVVAALTAYSEEAGKAAAAESPEAADNPAFDKATDTAIEACQAVGVSVDF
ncbi:hypothetical protein Strop_3342 [Salinispora tropica CNB-440]|uniref:Uncharacterized protein n=1 Tax=Salinispora tropica (strain ATCC BAA-916 / DSM 44818 / JCM 13857 / NBRC 105044 / CNB-440) TaxID=369723 RepID=A4XA36_SALTO|nr:hypothetical protein Strop_3342 [Salinispora tropica CNB-440]